MGPAAPVRDSLLDILYLAEQTTLLPAGIGRVPVEDLLGDAPVELAQSVSATLALSVVQRFPD
jgi:hypothetical protein